MNKDLDERLVQNGEYRHALNVQVRTTDSASDEGIGNAGTVQNMLGNALLNQLPNVFPEDNKHICVGSVGDEKNDKAYFLFGSSFNQSFSVTDINNIVDNDEVRIYFDTIIETNFANNLSEPVVVDVWKVIYPANSLIAGGPPFGPSTVTGNYFGQNESSTAWTELNVTDVDNIRPGMFIRFWDSSGNVTLEDVEIKAIDENTILLKEQQTIELTATNSMVIEFYAPKVLNFRSELDDNFVTGINVIDDFLIWTDNKSEPKKIHIPRSKAGTNPNGSFHTKLFLTNPEDTSQYVDANTLVSQLDNGGLENGSGINSYLKEEHITVIKKSPKAPPTLEMSSNHNRNGVVNSSCTFSFFSDYDESTNISDLINYNDSRVITIDSSNTNFITNDILIFELEADSDSQVTATFISYLNENDEEVLESTNRIKINLITAYQGITENDVVWNLKLQQREPLFELKLVRFGYRYKYEDGEYSSFSPWSELAFLPGEFDYKINKGFNLGMVNNVRELIIKDFIPYTMPLDVVSVDILYKTTDAPSVYIAETIDIGSNQWELFTPNGEDSTQIKTGRLSITSEMIHRVLPENQALRSWDNVPRYALAQEIIGNRLVLGNYTQGYDIGGPINLTQNIVSASIPSSLVSQPPFKSVKSLRDYKVGMVFGDKYGRETPVISPGHTLSVDETVDSYDSIVDGITVDKTLCGKQNSITVSQNWENGSSPDDWIDYVKYYVKETSSEYYNLVMDRWYDSGDGTVWLSFNSADRNKVDEETYLILKNGFGNQTPVVQKSKYKILAIENEAPDFVKKVYIPIGHLGAPDISDSQGVGGLDQNNTVTDTVWANGQDANTGPPTGLIENTTLAVSNSLWQSIFPDPEAEGFDGNYFGQEIKGLPQFRIIGTSLDGTSSNFLYSQATDWVSLTNYKKISVGDSPYIELQWSQPLGSQVDFYTTWVNSNGITDINNNALDPMDLVYSIEFRDSVTENKPWFDGKFFVKIQQDALVQQEVMTYSLGFQWQALGSYDMAYISSTVANESLQLGAPYTGQSAVLTWQSVLDGLTGDSLSTSWWYSNFNQILDSGPDGSGSWTNLTNNVTDDFFETGVREFCANGPFTDFFNENDTFGVGVTWGFQLGPQVFNGLPNGQWTEYEGQIYSCDSCTSIASTANGSDFEDSFHSSSNTYFANPDNSDEFNILANSGVFASCTWQDNFETRNFWRAWTDSHNQTYQSDTIFLDSSKTRFFEWFASDGYQVYDSEYQEQLAPGLDDPRQFFKHEAFSNSGNVSAGTYDEMTISYIYPIGGGPFSGDALELWNQLDTEDNLFFSIGDDPQIYKIINVRDGQGVNYSKNTLPGFNGEVGVIGGNPSSVSGDVYVEDVVTTQVNDFFTEQCVPCNQIVGTTLVSNAPLNLTEDQLNDLFEYPSGSVVVGQINVNNTGTYPPDDKKGCLRFTKKIRFVAVDSTTVAYLQDGPNNVGANLETYDPRGHLHHDGRDTLKIFLKKPVPVSYIDSDPNNELGAVWETEPKEDLNLDLYYEASGAIPIRLNKENAFNFAPINSSVSIKRNVPQGSNIYVLSDIDIASTRSDLKVSNIHFTDQSNEAILEIVSKKQTADPNLSNEFFYHSGPFDIEGAQSTDLYPAFDVDIKIGDVLTFTHSNGTETRATVTSYWQAVTPSPDVFTQPGMVDASQTLSSGPFSFSKKTNTFSGSDQIIPSGLYGVSIDVWNEDVKLPWFNCYAFGNGVESDRIRDDFNAPTIDNGVKVSTTFSGYGEEEIKSGMIYSGIYNSTSQINRLNEFNMSEKITKELNPRHGSIQRLKSRDTDMVVFAEDKVLRLLANKDAIFNADGNPQLTATDKVLGQAVPYAGDYGISKNPESLAWDQYRMYFTDKQRGAVLRLSQDGLTPISNVGMKSWFKDRLSKSDSLLGTFDVVNGEYNLTIKDPAVTVAFNEGAKGWVSFRSFIASNGLSVSGKYVTTNENGIWLHHQLVSPAGDIINRNNFYGEDYRSRITLLFNSQPSSIKSFKTINYEGSDGRIIPFLGHTGVVFTGNVNTNTDGDITSSVTSFLSATDNEYYNLTGQDGWWCSNIRTDLESGRVPEFKKKEGKWFNNISGTGVGTNFNIFDTDQFSVQGIGQLAADSFVQNASEGDGSNCYPICPDGYVCSEGTCEEEVIIISGCTNPLADNYNPAATVDDGSCQVTIIGCMDPIAPNYNPSATVTDDIMLGTLSCNGCGVSSGPCITCDNYVFGCYSNPNAVNYNPFANRDGRCYYGGVLVPCFPGPIDTFIEQPGASCMFEGNLNCSGGGTGSEAQLSNSAYGDLNGCIDQIEGCTNPGYSEYNPYATIDNGTCLSLCGENTVGCTDVDACNYDINATIDSGNCDYCSCKGCMDSSAVNYNPFATKQCNEPVDIAGVSIEESLDNCCIYNGLTLNAVATVNVSQGGDGNIVGCTCPGYANYNPNAIYQCWEVPFEECCGPSTEVGVVGCMEEIINLANATVTNYNPDATIPGICQYEVEYCSDESAINYNIGGWLDYLTSNYTLVPNDSLCVATVLGCTNPDMFNYDASANVEDGSCIPFIYGCDDLNSWNYNPFLNSTIAGQNQPYYYVPTITSYAGYSNTSFVYDGECQPIIYGCMDDGFQAWSPHPGIAATNYAGPGNTNNIDPPANTQFTQTFTPAESGYGLPSMEGGSGGVGTWYPGTDVSGVSTNILMGDDGVSGLQCPTCLCTYPETQELQVINYPGDTAVPGTNDATTSLVDQQGNTVD